MPGPRARSKKGGRPDAASRHFDTIPQLGAVKNKRDGVEYVWVKKDDELTMGQYLAGGYKSVAYEKDGPQPLGGQTSEIGGDVMLMGNVLMQVSSERHEEIVRQGLFGGSGLDARDEYVKNYAEHRGTKEAPVPDGFSVERMEL